ncbi:uncharacterized protein LOC117817375 [Notolabrus celidotus]|uniref:uncharacterized protein LOC117817375 n=1 Tax=Notolabrus celidotus TaxID=1203425 RepID=UPI00148FF5EA|nr:uncharacterized protein LOC117817375 [Notolabrus celidotus]
MHTTLVGNDHYHSRAPLSAAGESISGKPRYPQLPQLFVMQFTKKLSLPSDAKACVTSQRFGGSNAVQLHKTQYSVTSHCCKTANLSLEEKFKNHYLQTLCTHSLRLDPRQILPSLLTPGTTLLNIPFIFQKRGRLEAADFFSTPVDPITAATEGQDLGAGRESILDPAAETRVEREPQRGNWQAARGESSSSSSRRRRTEMDEQSSTGSIRHS